jgi:hypothetical protein
LADGNQASVGDLIITRRNDRRLRISATDWVKNGDRWTVLRLTSSGDVRVQNVRNGRTVTLPADYVHTATELGYATTVHTAQGVTADTMHGVVTGEESRQQLYTMVTRGRTANHLYVSVVGDGDPHAVLQPGNVHVRTATELLKQVLGRDGSPRSASTLQREHHDPAVRLGAAAARYLDALHLAAERLAGPQLVANLEKNADRILHGLTAEPAWPTLRSHLLLMAAAGAHPVDELLYTAETRDLTSADDQAAVIDSRIHQTNEVAAGGPLPWLPGIPHRLAADPNWGPYLHARSQLIRELADQVRGDAAAEKPAWAPQRHAAVPAELIADIQVWRAAIQVDPSDLRPTGSSQFGRATDVFQRELDMRLAATDTRTERQWRQLVAAEVPRATKDPFLPELAGWLSNLPRIGIDAAQLLRSAAAAGPLSDDHAAAALWSRIVDRIPKTQIPTHNAVQATRRTTASAPRPRSTPPRTLGASG